MDKTLRSNKVRTAVVGLGKMGLSHCAILNTHPDVDLVGICDTSRFVRRALSRNTDMNTFKDLDSLLLDARPSALIVATPTSSHFELLCQAMARGIHVFSEKPLCLDNNLGKELVRLAAESGLVNQVGYHNRFVGAFREVRRLVAEGAIGKIVHYRAEAYGAVVRRPSGSTWRGRPSEGGGCLNEYASHVLDLSNFVLGPPDRVSGTALPSIYSPHVEDAVYATLWHGTEFSGQLAVNWCDETYRKMTTQIEVLGTGGKVFADRQEVRIFVKSKEGFRDLRPGWTVRYIGDTTEPTWFYLRGEEYSAQIDHFVSRVRTASNSNDVAMGEPLSSFASALQTDEVIRMLLADAGRG